MFTQYGKQNRQENGREGIMTIRRESILGWIADYGDVITANMGLLTELDSAIGDADHGANMHRGFQVVQRKLPNVFDNDIGAVLKFVGTTLVSSVGGAGGPLYRRFFIQMGTVTPGKIMIQP